MVKRNYLVIGRANKKSAEVQYSAAPRTKKGAKILQKKLKKLYPKASLRIVEK